MKLALVYDLATDTITGDAVPSNEPPKVAKQQRGGARLIEIKLESAGDSAPLGEGEYLQLSYKPADAPDSASLFTANFTAEDLVEGTTSTYRKTVSLYTVEMDAALGIDDDASNDLGSIALRANITLFNGDDVEQAKSEFFELVFTTDYGRATDTTPAGSPGPDLQWVAHGHEQDLTSDQQLQARTNIGAVSAAEAAASAPVTSVAGRTGAVSLTKSDVSLSNVDNTSDANKPVSTATQTALDAKVPATRTVAGHALSADITVSKSDVGLSNVDNTSDANKPVSTAQQTALDAKVPATRTVAGHALSADVTVSKSDVGLGNADNTSDANKPVSTATQTALNAKASTTHASAHQSGGGDAIKLDDLAAPDDNTDLNATTGHHGLLPKLSGSATDVLLGTGAFGASPGGGGGGSFPTPGVAYINSGGNDTTGDGSPGAPFLTAQKAWDVGGFSAWRLGAGSFSVTIAAAMTLAIFGEGRENTSLAITSTGAASSSGSAGSSGAGGQNPGENGQDGGPGSDGTAGGSAQSVTLDSDKTVSITISTTGANGGAGGQGGFGGNGFDDGASSANGGAGGTPGNGGMGGDGGFITLRHCAVGGAISGGGGGGPGGDGRAGGSPSGAGGSPGASSSSGNGGNGGANGVITLFDCDAVGLATAHGPAGAAGSDVGGGSGSAGSDGADNQCAFALSRIDSIASLSTTPQIAGCIIAGAFTP